MTTGVFNPYVAKKKKKKPPPTFGNPAEEIILGNIRLDGDSYVLELQHADLKDIPARLGALLKDVSKDHGHILVRHGIDILPPGHTRQLEAGEVSLPTPDGHICVFIGEHDSNQREAEIQVFRRLACALREVPRTILVKNQAKILERA